MWIMKRTMIRGPIYGVGVDVGGIVVTAAAV